MLPRIVLLVIQIAVAWFVADPLRALLPAQIAPKAYDVFAYAVLYALIVSVVGFAGSLVLKNVRVPSSATFGVSLVLALIGAGLTLFPPISNAIDSALPLLKSDHKVYALVGALIGYTVKR